MKRIIYVLPLLVITLSGCSSHNNKPSQYTSEELYNIEHGITPHKDEQRGTYTYGLYPQSVVADEALINELNGLSEDNKNDYGWYLYNDNYYVKEEAHLLQEGTIFHSTYEEIVDNQVYWFKCEPIEWLILQENENEVFLLSNRLLDIKAFCTTTIETRSEGEYIDGIPHVYTDIRPNNYRWSTVRKWLNNEFYNSAFINNNEHVKTTEVDNSAASNDSEDNPYLCENTLDKVFILSVTEYTNKDLGFTDITYMDLYDNDLTKHSYRRHGEFTDYGTLLQAERESVYNQATRSPSRYGYPWVWGMTNKSNEQGHLFLNMYVDGAPSSTDRATYDPSHFGYGVRPAIKISK